MPLFKRSKKSRQPSKQSISLGIPTQIALGVVGINAELDPEIAPEGLFHLVKSMSLFCRSDRAAGENNAKGSRIVLRDSREFQRSSVPGTPTPTREGEDGITTICIIP